MALRALTQALHALWPWYAIKALMIVAQTPKTMVRMASVVIVEGVLEGAEDMLRTGWMLNRTCCNQ